MAMNFIIVTPPPRRLGEAAPQSGTQQPATAQPGQTAAAGQTANQDIFRSSPEAKPNSLSGVDRRWSQRVSIGKAGWLAAANLDGPVSCKVCNTSKHGALLELDRADAIGKLSDKPLATVTLVWLNNRIRSEANCTIRWRNRRLLGVSFIGPVRTTLERRG